MAGLGPIPVTTLLSTFTSTTTPASLTPTLKTKLKEVLIDYIAVVLGGIHNAESSLPIYNSILSLQGGPVPSPSACTVIGKGPPHFLPQYAALLNATFGHSLDFDDTYEPGTLHAGITAISAALTTAETLLHAGQHVTIERFMLAVAVGYEVTCRIGRELGYEAYDRGFHNTGTAGIFGAVASIASLKRLEARVVEMAFGLAGSKAAGSMQYLDNGSWNKRLHPGFAVHDAFLCVGLAENGVIGATRSIEGKNGFLQAYSPRMEKDLSRLVSGLGEEWVWLASSLKPFPACRMTHSHIEVAGNIHTRFSQDHRRRLNPKDVTAITVKMSHANFLLVGEPTANKIHPENVIDAQFSVYFQVANALLHGSNSGLQAYQRLNDPDIHALCSKIVVLMDRTAPAGFPADVGIVWDDGKEEVHHQPFPLGEVQHPFTRDRVDEKFVSLVAPVFGQDRASTILQTVDNLESSSISNLMSLLREP